MKLNQILIYTLNLQESTEFYTQLGFEVDSTDSDVASLKLNDFVIQLINNSTSAFPIENSKLESFKSEGFFIYIEVEDVDKFYKDILNKGIKTSTEPKNWDWGKREFVVRDPSGYALVFYTKV